VFPYAVPPPTENESLSTESYNNSTSLRKGDHQDDVEEMIAASGREMRGLQRTATDGELSYVGLSPVIQLAHGTR